MNLSGAKYIREQIGVIHMSSVFDKPKATDVAKQELEQKVESGKPGYWNKLRASLEDAAIKCKMMCTGGSSTGCGNSNSEEGDCKFTEE